MIDVVGCLTSRHDLRLVLLAAIVCGLASFAVVRLFRHAAEQTGKARALWIGTCGLAGGAGVWATHFIAMLAYDPGVPTSYAVDVTFVSLVIAVCAIGAGLLLALDGRPTAGGAVVGLGVAAMHFVGMLAFETIGHIAWDLTIVATAVGCSVALGAAALRIGSNAGLRFGTPIASAVLVLSICSLHFTAMGAVTIVPDAGAVVRTDGYDRDLIAVAVAVTSVLVILFAGAALSLDLHELRRRMLEAERMDSLANASAEGLVICRGDVIVTANDNFARLSGVDGAALRRSPIGMFFDAGMIAAALASRSEALFEGELTAEGGRRVPVELFVRAIDRSGGEPRYAIAARDLRARRKAEHEIRRLAHHDMLTGLPNRASFSRAIEERVAMARSTGGRFGLLYIDLDRFKEINDRHGHAAGDAVLKRTASVVGRILEPGQMLARLGGDEFALLTAVGTEDGLDHVARDVVALLNAVDDDGATLSAASVGSAAFPADADDAETLLVNADVALYRAKSEGRGVWRAFSAAMGVEASRRLTLEHELRGAIRRGELSLVFQPQISIATGALYGYEALARWRRANGESVSPGVFIPLAEETGLIGQIGDWALRTACGEAASWRDGVSVAVNISAAQLLDPALAHTMLQALTESGLEPGRLIVEITETALVSDPQRALATLRRIKALGVLISMDDFGVGYSSLSNLHTYPFDKIKIDQSFVRNIDRNPQKAAIVRTIIALGRELDLPVLAEGVETEQELAFLRAAQCDLVQGYLTGRPGPIAREAATAAAVA